MSRFPALVQDGKLVPKVAERLAAHEGREVWVEVHKGPAAGLRSNSGNAYLWGHLYRTISEETGNDPQTIHLALKRLAVEQGVLEPQYVLLGDKLIEGEPTTRVDEDAFLRYVSWVKHYALHDLGIVIPED